MALEKQRVLDGEAPDNNRRRITVLMQLVVLVGTTVGWMMKQNDDWLAAIVVEILIIYAVMMCWVVWDFVRENRDFFQFFNHTYVFYLKRKAEHIAVDIALYNFLAGYSRETLSLLRERFMVDRKVIFGRLDTITGIDKLGLLPALASLALIAVDWVNSWVSVPVAIVVLFLYAMIFVMYGMLPRMERYISAIDFVLVPRGQSANQPSGAIAGVNE